MSEDNETYTIFRHYTQSDGQILTHVETNDNNDDGMPDGTLEVYDLGPWSRDAALKSPMNRSHTGVSGIRVTVYLDDQEITEDWRNSPSELKEKLKEEEKVYCLACSEPIPDGLPGLDYCDDCLNLSRFQRISLTLLNEQTMLLHDIAHDVRCLHHALHIDADELPENGDKTKKVKVH